AARQADAVDLVHACPLPYSSILHAGLALARRTKAKLVLTPFTHLGKPDDAADRVRRRYLSRLNVRLLRQADGVLAQTNAESRALAEAGIADHRIRLGGVG